VKNSIESVSRIEPTRLSSIPESLIDLIASLTSKSSSLGARLHPKTAANLADLIKVMNCYYSNLIEGHSTRPKEIQQALDGEYEDDIQRRNLQIEALAHIEVQQKIDQKFLQGELPDPASLSFIQWLHEEFYRNMPAEMLEIKSNTHQFQMKPGEYRSQLKHDNVIGKHIPPSSDQVVQFMKYFEQQYSFSKEGGRILTMAYAHHRFNYIHPFPDGNGRVSRLMSHAMGLKAGIGASGLWSISRGLARGLSKGISGRDEYKRFMSLADTPRQGEMDGRGNLSEKALIQYTEWFLSICVDQVTFMTEIFDLNTLSQRLKKYIELSDTLKPEANNLLQEVLMRGEIERGEAGRITNLPERSARRVLKSLIDEGLLKSDSPLKPVSLRFPEESLGILFPSLFT